MALCQKTDTLVWEEEVNFAGDEGVEPSINLLERFVIPLHQSPLAQKHYIISKRPL